MRRLCERCANVLRTVDGWHRIGFVYADVCDHITWVQSFPKTKHNILRNSPYSRTKQPADNADATRKQYFGCLGNKGHVTYRRSHKCMTRTYQNSTQSGSMWRCWHKYFFWQYFYKNIVITMHLQRYLCNGILNNGIPDIPQTTYTWLYYKFIFIATQRHTRRYYLTHTQTTNASDNSRTTREQNQRRRNKWVRDTANPQVTQLTI